ncbi:MAG: LCP family protein [Clostridiales bacterium]|nr:LCP family protein [Clostridiales bacterium]
MRSATKKFFRNLIIIFVVLFGGIFAMYGAETVTEFFEDDSKVNFIVFGLDKSQKRSDSMILGQFDPSDESLELVSVPRDTLISTDQGQMKLNAAYSVSREFAIEQIENLLGVTLPYYITINLEAFKDVVDEIGGVEFEVPFRMRYYDPAQNLNIDLEPGYQTLNGIQAEGLVRFRKSSDGSHSEYNDWDRTLTQQEFVKAVLMKFSQRENVDIPKIAGIFLEYVETNVDIAMITKYWKYVKTISPENIYTQTLVGHDERLNGLWYTILNLEESQIIVDNIFNEPVRSEGSQGKSIAVLNGGLASGLAARNRDYLTSRGFEVSDVGDYNGERVDYTRIFVKNKSWGRDIQELYPGSKIIVSQSEFDKDIVVVVGIDKNQ